MEHPLISVIICNYNYGRYIGEAIESVFGQTYPNLELIIIDDGSTDNSRTIIEKFLNTNPTIRYYKQRNRGIVPARNRGLRLARGEFLMFLDSDNTIPQNYIEELYNLANARRADVVYTNLKYFGKSSGLAIMNDFNIELLKYQNFIDMSALIRRSAIQDIKFDMELSNRGLVCEDWDFFLNLAMSGAKIIKSHSVTLNYRIHGKSRNNDNPFRQQNIETLIYIIGKNAKKYHYSAQEALENLIRQFGGGEALFDRLERIIKYDEAEIKNLKKQVEDIRKSHSYRLGQTLLSPIKLISRRSK